MQLHYAESTRPLHLSTIWQAKLCIVTKNIDFFQFAPTDSLSESLCCQSSRGPVAVAFAIAGVPSLRFGSHIQFLASSFLLLTNYAVAMKACVFVAQFREE